MKQLFIDWLFLHLQGKNVSIKIMKQLSIPWLLDDSMRFMTIRMCIEVTDSAKGYSKMRDGSTLTCMFMVNRCKLGGFSRDSREYMKY